MAGHNMAIPGGPVLNIRGFFDFNFGVGSIANPWSFRSSTTDAERAGTRPRRRIPLFKPASSICS